ncbi:MAG: NPCBM/NEW2 domain-containing protein [Planctomycetaceae bacterium]|nr:NPCBM/NEW2 domain-containing protein [Planctomycetaceae bacterium]
MIRRTVRDVSALARCALLFVIAFSSTGFLAAVSAEEPGGNIWRWTHSDESLEAVAFEKLLKLDTAECMLGLADSEATYQLEGVWRISVNAPEQKERTAGARQRVYVQLSNGDIWVTKNLRLDEESLTVMMGDDHTAVRTPIEHVRTISWGRPTSLGTEISVRELVATESNSPNSDVLLLKNGDRLLGEVQKIFEEGVLFAVDGADLTIPREQLRELQMNPALVSSPSYVMPCGIIQIRDGTQFTASSVVVEGQQVLASLNNEVTVKYPLTQLQSIDFFSEKTRPLLWEPPTAATHENYFGNSDPLRSGASVDGNPLLVDGQTYPLGIGVRSQSSVTFTVPSNAQTLWLLVGLADEVNGKGSLDVKISGM